MEQLIKDFGHLLGMHHFHLNPGEPFRLELVDVGDLDLLHEEGRLLMRLTKPVSFFDKEFFLNLLTATHYRHSLSQPMRPWFQKPDRIGYGFIFCEEGLTPDTLFHALEYLTTEFRKI